MYNYVEITNELISKAKILKENIFYYEFSPIKDIYERYFQFCQTNLSEYTSQFDIQPARFFYREANGVNAIAGLHDSYFIIGVNKGTIWALYELFYERNDIFEKDSELGAYSDLRRTLNDPLEILMFQLASLFTYYHEQGHLIQKSRILLQWINEMYHESDERVFSQERHVLEFDADLNAAHFICYHLIEYWKKQDNKFRTQERLQQLLSLGAASVFSYFMLLNSNSEDIYYKKDWHPHPIVRISYIIDCFIKVALLNIPGELQLESNVSLVEGFRISGVFFKSVLGVNAVGKFASIYQSESLRIKEYIDELIALAKNNPALVQSRPPFPKRSRN